MGELSLSGFTVCVSSPAAQVAMRDRGARVVPAPAEPDVRGTRRLVDLLVLGQVDCLALDTSPLSPAHPTPKPTPKPTPLLTRLLASAADDDRSAGLLSALRDHVLVVCSAPDAELLAGLGTGAVDATGTDLVSAVETELPSRRTRAVRAGRHELRLRGHDVLVDGARVELTGRQAGVLSALVSGGGNVLSRAELLRLAWRDETADEHAVEMTVARLRSTLGPAGSVVQTVVKRGYRLAAPTP